MLVFSSFGDRLSCLKKIFLPIASMTKSDISESYRLLIGGVVAIACLTGGLIWGVSQKMGRNVLKPRQFTCAQMEEPSNGQSLWTVLFQKDGQEQPLLRIVPGLEGDITPERRCEEIAQVLDVQVVDQLETLFHRPNPATPGRHAVCVQTARHDRDDCANLVILKEETEPQSFFEKFTVDLQDFPEVSQQQTESNGAIATFSTSNEQPPQGLAKIDLRPYFPADVSPQ